MTIAVIVIISILALCLVVGLSLASFSGNELKEFFDKNMASPSSSYMTALEFAKLLNDYYFGGRINIAVDDTKTDTGAYFPALKRITLSSKVASSASVSALTVCAHEFGHAYQYHKTPDKLNRNYKFSKLVKVLGVFVLPLLVVSILLLVFSQTTIGIIIASMTLLIFLTALAFKISIIKIEKEASAYALELLSQTKILNENELKVGKKLLKLALQTYIGDFFRAMLFWTMLVPKTKIFN